MSDVVIQVEGLGKRYRIGRREGYLTLRDALVKAAKKPFGWISRNGSRINGASNDGKYIWALKDVSFQVKQGEVVGIIGRNGAGKSTLLKLLARITKPTEGHAEVSGRIGSLLEVGTGFHPELTGRENIYLSGVILGMKKREIDKKFDEIVSFAEIEKFIDTPVKFYSSGMYVRLAFAVAAHLEPEILLVDEVLAVGDVAFQKKCLGKMGDVAKEGRTVLFVSHNMASIIILCRRALWIENGQLRVLGDTQSVVGMYLSSGSEKQGEAHVTSPQRPSDVVITKCFVLDDKKQISADVDFRYPFFVGLEYVVKRPIHNLQVAVRLKNEQGVPVIFSADRWSNFETTNLGTYRAWVEIPGHLLVPGRYYVDLSAAVWRVKGYHYAHDCLAFDVCQTNFVDGREPGMGVICPELQWFRDSLD